MMNETMSSLAKRLMNVFDGLPRSYGRYPANLTTNAKGKRTGKAETIRKRVTIQAWQDHVDGKEGIGITPIRDDGTVMFGAFDIDDYELSHVGLIARLEAANLPIVVCRSKSGGAHCYLFCEGPVMAVAMCERLAEIVRYLRLSPTTEIFPKQVKLASEEDCGSWLNMPYMGGMTGMRYAIRPNGDAIDPEEFPEYVETRRVTPEWFSTPLDLHSGASRENPSANHLPAERVPADRFIGMALGKVAAGEGRNDAGMWLSCQLRDAGFSRDEAQLVLREWVTRANAATVGQGRYTAEEAKATLRSAYKRDARKPWANNDSKVNQADELLKLTEDFEYFKSGPSNDAYVRMVIDSHKEVWKVDAKSPKVREVLTCRYLMKHGRAPGREALNAVIDTVVAKCGMRPKVPVHVRFARSSDVIYLDLCDETWRVIKVTKDGWGVVDNPPVLFRRPSGARALPVPTGGESVEALRSLLNCEDDAQWILMLAWLVGVFLPEGAFVHLNLGGEQGSAKSTVARILQSLIDPSDAGLSAPPKDESDATIAGMNSGILAYDNLSGCRAELSDTFCRFSTGQGYRTRTLYETMGLTVVELKIPVLLNGIDSTVVRADLLERCITLRLPRITPKNRRTESAIWNEFAAIHAGCLGAVLDAASAGLRNLASTGLTDPPRMADFALWLVACEPALPWVPGEFIAAYRRKMKDASRDLAEGDPVAAAIVEWAQQSLHPGAIPRVLSAKDLLVRLNNITQGTPKDLRYWPASPEALAHRLRRLVPLLRAQGVEVEQTPRGREGRRWQVSRPGTQWGLGVVDELDEAA